MSYKLLLYCNKKYEKQAEALIKRAQGVFDEVICYKEEYLKDSDFFKENQEILKQERGAGYWLWKPYIILDSFEILQPNDKVLYLDCGDTFNNRVLDSLDSILDDSDICLTEGKYKNSDYTKRDCFTFMNCDSESFWSATQVEAGVIAFRPSLKSQEFFEEWLYFCKNPSILTDSPNIFGIPNSNGFKDHRHDQSILTNLSVKHGIKISSIIRESVNCNKND